MYIRRRISLAFGLILGVLPATILAQQDATYYPQSYTDTLAEDGLYREVLRLPLPAGTSYQVAYAFGPYTAKPAPQTFQRLNFYGSYPEQPVVLGPRVTEKGQSYQLLYRYGAQLTQEGELLAYDWVTYKLDTLSDAMPVQARLAVAPKSASVLATGNWYQVRVSASGVYKIDRGVLQGLGVNPDAVNPANLRIYGMSLGLLPQANAAPRPDDLQPVALRLNNAASTWGNDTYAEFFAQGPHAWQHDTLNYRFYHEQHLYSDYTYYYLTFDQGLNPATITTTTQTASSVASGSATCLAYYEYDAVNLTLSGRQYFDNPFSSGTNTYSLELPVSDAPNESKLRLRMAARAATNSQVSLTVQGVQRGNYFISSVNLSDVINDYARQTFDSVSNLNAPTNGTYTVLLDFIPGSQGTGWLDYLEIVAQYPSLNFIRNGECWTLPASQDSLKIPVTLGGRQLWEITDPLRPIHLNLLAGTLTYAANRRRHFYAFDPANLPTPTPVGQVVNQNLHGMPAAELLIVSPPEYLEAANRLAEHHRTADGMAVGVATTTQIFHEFSSGAQDATAIRDFVRMFYLRHLAQPSFQAPKYLLLLGDASYDNLGRAGEPGKVVSYQSRHSLRRLASYIGDDYFGFLDENEGFWGEASYLYPYDDRVDLDLLDVGVGRLPVESPEEALAMADKIIHYATSDEVSGDWQTQALVIGDYKDGEPSLHSSQADEIADTLLANEPCMRTHKVFLDQYPADYSGSRVFFPQARDEIHRLLREGVLLVNYTGHGSEVSLSNSTIFTEAEGATLDNPDRPAFWMSATCEFGRHDNPTLTSGIETLLTRAEGGAIGSLTSTRLVYSQSTFLLSRNWYRFAVDREADGNNYLPLGESFRLAKNATYPLPGGSINTRNFSLLGDPAMRLKIPAQRIVISHVNGQPVGTDTLKALQQLTLTGEIQGPTGGRLTGFNGEVTLVVFDKEQTYKTLIDEYTYQDYRSVLFNGSVSVTNGQFQVSFVMPLDINYTPGPGNLQLFAEASGSQAAGCWQQAVICCTDPAGVGDDTPPQVQLYLGDENWRSGGRVGPSTQLIAYVQDNLGINPSGQGVGRELLATLDGDPSKAYNLGPYYVSQPDDPKQGSLIYNLEDLEPGTHTLSLKVWDVANNSATAVTEFTVVEGTDLSLIEILAYPNPYNPAQGPLQLQLNIPTSQRPLHLKVDAIGAGGSNTPLLEAELTQEGYLEHLQWPGDASGTARLASGIYVLRFTLTDPATGAVAEKLERLLLIRP